MYMNRFEIYHLLPDDCEKYIIATVAAIPNPIMTVGENVDLTSVY